MGAFLDTTEDEFDKILQVNIKASFLLTREAYPLMRSGGSFTYVSSIGAYQPFCLIGAYSVSKTALLGLAKAVAQQSADRQIRANCVCPGIIRTRFSQPFWQSDEAMAEICRLVPAQR
ncbi:dehydrogenase/reductase SDR family member 4-like [Oppia nitens]|uniref:dehydrogenase/reductase SDR family member 4-like n=1 Tax=Oppia nitens TaxID=1686743 RepID=UPI0023DACD68|nr:dehydrogenase/reductase SDR family member 4-like [Oppia nitens]